MLPDLFSQSTLPVLEQVVMFSQARHGVLAGNIANLDTPGYKSRDLSPDAFQESLKQAIEASRQPSAPESPGQAALLGGGEGLITPQGQPRAEPVDYDAFKEVRESFKSVMYHDESDVSLEQQITELSKNQATHNLAIRLMTLQFRQLRAAISENPA